jgi:uncharacterized protein
VARVARRPGRALRAASGVAARPGRPDTLPGPGVLRLRPGVRVLATVEPAEPSAIEIPVSRGETHRFTRFGHVRFELYGEPRSLGIYWLEGYGGGAYLPFADATSGDTTYGAGRYLLDTVKGADLGAEGDRLVLDFNFAYNPSCAYDPRWACPLAPLENRLPVAVRAGERNVWRSEGSRA